MTKIERTERIEVNDRVVTAGLDLGRRFQSIFPKGIPIGRVVDVQAEPGAIEQTALVQPTTDLDRVEDVLVIVDLDGRRRSRTAEDSGNAQDAEAAGTDDAEAASEGAQDPWAQGADAEGATEVAKSAAEAAAAASPATKLTGVSAREADGGVVIELAADGRIDGAEVFTVADPLRLVIDRRA